MDFYFTQPAAARRIRPSDRNDMGAMRDTVRFHLTSLATAGGQIELESAYTLNSARGI